MASELTLGDFVKVIAVRINEAGMALPFKEEAPWHYLLYELKKMQRGPQKAAFLNSLRFDWDGPYPRCQELSDFIQALHWTGSITVGNPSYDRIILNNELSAKWKEEAENFAPEMGDLLGAGVEIARREFPVS